MAADEQESTSVSTGEKALNFLGLVLLLVLEFTQNDNPDDYPEYDDDPAPDDYPEYDDAPKYNYPEYDLRDLEDELDDEDFIEREVYPAVLRKRNRRNRSLTKFDTPRRIQLRKAS